MRLLLDTHILLWWHFEPHRIRPTLRASIASPENDVFFSAASIWEIAIKAALGRTDFAATPHAVLAATRRAEFEELPIRSETTLLVSRLPRYHSDPFDRLLIAQAVEKSACLCTHDRAIHLYSDVVELA